MSETDPFGAAGDDSSSPEKKRVTKTDPRLLNRRDFLKLLAGSAAALGLGWGIRTYLQLTPQEQAKPPDIPKTLTKILEDPTVQSLTNDQNLGKISKDLSAKDKVAYAIDRTQVYLAGGSPDNWTVLLNHLDSQKMTEEDLLWVLGQKYALGKANCLTNGHIDIGKCNNQAGFAGLGSGVKEEYAQKFNAFVDAAKQRNYPGF